MGKKGINGVSIYKPAGRSEPHHKWLVAYRVGPRREVRAVSNDYQEALAFAERKVQEAKALRLGLATHRDLKIAAAAAVPLLDSLDQEGTPEGRPNHLDEYLQVLRARRRTPKQVQQVGSRVARLFRLAEFEYVDQITSDGIELAHAILVDQGELADRTGHHYLKAAKQFTRWLRRSSRARYDELEDVELPAVLEIVHRRRALSDQEVAALIQAAQAGEPIGRISGPERALVYLLAVTTGLRANELRTLTREAFLLEEDPPLVVVEACHSKHRKRDEQPMRRDVADRLRPFLAQKRDGQRVWAIPDKPVRMMEVDLAAAGIPKLFKGQVADFHALRHTFCTRIGRSGATIKDAQVLMRHTDVRLTAQYMHSGLRQQVNVLEALPAILPTVLRATGTDCPARAASPFPGAAMTAIPPSRIDVSSVSSNTNRPIASARRLRSSEPQVAGSNPARCDLPTADGDGGCGAGAPGQAQGLSALLQRPGTEGLTDQQLLDQIAQLHATLSQRLRGEQ